MVTISSGARAPSLAKERMVKNAGGRVDLQHQQESNEKNREAQRARPPSERRNVLRVEARIDKDVHMVGRVGRFRLESDEPPERGGTDLAPAPLQYFLFGAGT
jgi:hypothetical protein